MPRKGRSGKRLIKGSIDIEAALGALADGNVAGANAGDTADSRSFVLSVEATYALDGQTAGEGPVEVYLCHSDYSTAEVIAYIENAGSWGEGDMVQQEIARRKIRHVGSFPAQLPNEVLNDGKPLKTKCKFIIQAADTLSFYAFNHSGAALTGGATLNVLGHAWLRPA